MDWAGPSMSSFNYTHPLLCQYPPWRSRWDDNDLRTEPERLSTCLFLYFESSGLLYPMNWPNTMGILCPWLVMTINDPMASVITLFWMMKLHYCAICSPFRLEMIWHSLCLWLVMVSGNTFWVCFRCASVNTWNVFLPVTERKSSYVSHW